MHALCDVVRKRHRFLREGTRYRNSQLHSFRRLELPTPKKGEESAHRCVWLDGDQDILAAWARDNKIRNLPLCVADSQIESLQPWNLNAGAAHTVILLKRRKVLAAYGELLSPTPARLMGESAIFD